jgi:hypothetical protein
MNDSAIDRDKRFDQSFMSLSFKSKAGRQQQQPNTAGLNQSQRIAGDLSQI